VFYDIGIVQLIKLYIINVHGMLMNNSYLGLRICGWCFVQSMSAYIINGHG
jgi:hypothetical protein